MPATFLPAGPLARIAANRTATYGDTVTFQSNGGGRRTGDAWADVGALSALPGSVRQVGASEEPVAGQHVGRRVFRVRVDVDVEAGVTPDAITAGMRVRAHARDGYPERLLALIEPGDHGHRFGRWIKVLAVDEGATT